MSSAQRLTELINRAQGGDVSAFETLVADHIPQIRRFTRGFTANAADADDLAQEVLVRLYQSIRSFRFQSAFSTWLFTLARNVCIDVSRREARHLARKQLLARSAQTDASLATAQAQHPPLQDEVIAQRRRQALLWAALRQLPLKFRSPLLLCDVEGLSYDEVAAIEKVPVGTIRSRLNRGRKHLRKTLEKRGLRAYDQDEIDECDRAETVEGDGASAHRATR